MGKNREPVLVDVAFTFTSDAQLNQLISDHRSAHQRTHGQVLAMHGRRALGAGRVMITFRVVDKGAA